MCCRAAIPWFVIDPVDGPSWWRHWSLRQPLPAGSPARIAGDGCGQAMGSPMWLSRRDGLLKVRGGLGPNDLARAGRTPPAAHRRFLCLARLGRLDANRWALFRASSAGQAVRMIGLSAAWAGRRLVRFGALGYRVKVSANA
jgi:hypothetical protein